MTTTLSPKIEFGDVDYSNLSETLRFAISVDLDTIKIVEDICGKENMKPDELAFELRNLLHSCVLNHYHRGGLKRNK